MSKPQSCNLSKKSSKQSSKKSSVKNSPNKSIINEDSIDQHNSSLESQGYDFLDQIESEKVFIIPQPITKSGDDQFEILYTGECKAYRFYENEWKERGFGEFRILKHKIDKYILFVLRQAKTFFIRINFIIKKDLIYEYLTGNNRVLTFKNIVDLSEGVDKPQKYFISLKFPNSELCDEFKSIMDLEILALKLNEIDLSKDKQNE